jgi:hypothetical protein
MCLYGTYASRHVVGAMPGEGVHPFRCCLSSGVLCLAGDIPLFSVLAGLSVGLEFPVAKALIPALGVLRTCLLTAVLKLCSLLLVATMVASKGRTR